MPQWSDTPPTREETFGWRLARVPASTPIELTIISSKPAGTYTHYYKGRTQPCPGTACEACTLGLPKRWHSYTAVQAFRTKENLILELTAQATEQLQPAIDEYKTLRAVKLIASRPSKKPNGRLLIRIVPGRTSEMGLPDEPNVTLLMAHIWGLDDQPITAASSSSPINRIQADPKPNGTHGLHPSAIP